MKSKVQLICLTVQHLGWIFLYTEKVHRNSQVPFLILAIIPFIPFMWYISRDNLLQGHKLGWYIVLVFFFCKIGQNVHRATHRYTFTRSPAHLHTYWINLNSFLHFLIYMVCERLLNRVGSLVEELGNRPFLRTQRNRGRAAYVGIWMVNRWITQSGVFLCRLAAVV